MMIMPQSNRTGARCFSLVEAAVATVVVGVMLVAALDAVGGVLDSRRRMLSWRVGDSLARDLMAEIVRARYQEPCTTPAFGRETGEVAASRAAWDDVDDYHGFTETNPVYRDGTGVPGATGWKRQVAVVWAASAAAPSGNSVSETGIKRITVTATSPRGQTTTLVALRSSSGAAEVALDPGARVIDWVGVCLKVGADGPVVSTATESANLPEEP